MRSYHLRLSVCFDIKADNAVDAEQAIDRLLDGLKETQEQQSGAFGSRIPTIDAWTTTKITDITE